MENRRTPTKEGPTRSRELLSNNLFQRQRNGSNAYPQFVPLFHGMALILNCTNPGEVNSTAPTLGHNCTTDGATAPIFSLYLLLSRILYGGRARKREDGWHRVRQSTVLKTKSSCDDLYGTREGEVDRLVVVEHLATAPGPKTASEWLPEFIKDFFRRF
jgi:hypothetical protein